MDGRPETGNLRTEGTDFSRQLSFGCLLTPANKKPHPVNWVRLSLDSNDVGIQPPGADKLVYANLPISVYERRRRYTSVPAKASAPANAA